ncbi:peptidase c14 caspase catalytic subunit P20, partial [Candidatus Magnetomorum sp. HK-1]
MKYCRLKNKHELNLKTGIFALIICIFLMCSSTAEQDNWAFQTAKTIGTNHAIIIGIDKYDNFEGIQGPTNDAEALYHLLTSAYHFEKENIVLLTSRTSEKPTRENIRIHLAEFLTISGNTSLKNDNLIIFYSGLSTEDKDGIYWIPMDAKADTIDTDHPNGPPKKQTWSLLGLKDLTSNFFNRIKVKHLLIITDSAFDHELISRIENQISINDFQYNDWMLEYGQRPSRKVIYSDDKARSTEKIPETGIFSKEKYADGFNDNEFIGILADKKKHTFFYTYLIQALQLNSKSIIDIENLMFDYDDIFLPLYNKVGRKIRRGKLNGSDDQDGLFIFVKKPPKIKNLVAIPPVVEQGKQLTLKIKTDFIANEVTAYINNEEYPMEGSGLHWEKNIKEQKTGLYEVFVEAAIDEQNRSHRYQTQYKITETCPTITKIGVTPKEGQIGDTFRFSAQIDVSAHHVTLTINGNSYSMSGSDTNWWLDLPVKSRGEHTFSIEAFNSQNFSKKPKKKIVFVHDRKINVLASSVLTKEPFAGKKVLIEAETDYPAKFVSLTINNTVYEMSSKSKKNMKNWICTIPVKQAGKLSYTVQAQNAENEVSIPKTYEFITFKEPPKILSIEYTPKKPVEGEIFSISVATNHSDQVNAKIDGKIYPIKGNGEKWHFQHSFDIRGKNKVEIVASNLDSKKSVRKIITIETLEKKYPTINISDVKISPIEGTLSDTYEFLISTDIQAKTVILEIDDQKIFLKQKKRK